MMHKTDRGTQHKDEDAIFPKALRYADFLVKHGAKVKLHRQSTFLTTTTDPSAAFKQRNEAKKVKEDSRKAVSSAETSDSSGSNPSTTKEGNSLADSKSRFPILGPTRQDTQLYFKRRHKTRLTFEDLKKELGIKNEKENAKDTFRQSRPFHHERSNTLQHIPSARNLITTNEVQTLTRSLPNLVVSTTDNALDSKRELDNSSNSLVPRKVTREKTLYPSIHGYHPRSFSPTYKRLIHAKDTLHCEMKDRLQEIKRIKTARTAENFYKKYLNETNDEDLAVIRTMEFMQSVDSEITADASETEPRAISLRTPMPERVFKFDKSIFDLSLHIFLPQGDNKEPLDNMESDDNIESRKGLPKRSNSHLLVKSNDRNILKPLSESQLKVRHKPQKSRNKSPKKLPKREIMSPECDEPLLKDDVETLMSKQADPYFSDAGNEAPDSETQEGSTEVKKDDPVKKSKAMKVKSRKKVDTKPEEPHLPKLTIASDFDALIEEHSKHPKVSLHHTDKVNNPSSKSGQVEDVSAENLLTTHETQNSQTERKESGVADDKTAEVKKEKKKMNPPPKPQSLADNKLIFDRQKAKAVTKLARMSNLTAEEANDLWLTRDAKILGNKYIDQYNKTAFGSDSESDDDDK
ncbi:uncharacterized protein LOC106173761 isoform X2 [Lingula anatina]|uniref:Uncharacterized protein LOC106173761 isoform X2 n=1 Tax=Lingula anatina TaxID=7574 RepID=A0A1S3GZ95_LINAN|nr:uncharacterized protein LOC106173761 isoform X2 [Lingula anatina]|eukprot:XP_013378551.1 uncharacterized protein LOC106173761 isoform X2 [Lingula anatina]